MMPIFDSKMYVEAYSALHASEDTLAQVMRKAAGARKMKRRLLPAFAALLALTVSVIAFAGGGMPRGAWRFRGTLKDMEKMGFCCPEQIGAYQVDEHSVSRFHVVKAETGRLKAFLMPDYVWMSVDYEKENGQGLSASLGAMDHPLWAYVAHYDVESNVWDGALHPENRTRYDEKQGCVTYIEQVTEYVYQNCAIYLYDRVTEYTDSADNTSALGENRNVCAVWTDLDRGMWFGLEAFHPLWEMDEEGHDADVRSDEGMTQEEMLGYVKGMIDGY